MGRDRWIGYESVGTGDFHVLGKRSRTTGLGAGTGEDPSITDMWDPQSLYGMSFVDDNPENPKGMYDNGIIADGVGTEEKDGVRFNGSSATTPFGDGLFKVRDESDPLNPNPSDFFFAAFIAPESGKKIVCGIGSDGNGDAYNVLRFER